MTAEGKTPWMPQQAPAAQAAVTQGVQEQMSLKAKGPLNEVSGNAGRTLAHLPMTPAVLRRGQDLGPYSGWFTTATATPSKAFS